MGDLLPPHAAERRALARALLRTFELYGYSLVTAPAFEHAEVIERGLDTTDPRELLRFVDPDSGEVAVLRPDITPQIARIVASRLQDTPGPFRLCYDGRVIRRRRGRARRHKQISQVGVELVGWSGVDADSEVITLAHRVCTESGLRDFRFELSHVSLAQSALDEVSDAARPAIAAALARKDVAAIETLARASGVATETRKRIELLATMHGDLSVLDRAAKQLRWRRARTALTELRAVINVLTRRGLKAQLGLDLSETRGSSYYTGVSFSILCDGPGEALGGGGRYDNLIGRYGAPAPATGFALDLENLQWALRHAGVAVQGSDAVRIALSGKHASAVESTADALRNAGVGVAVVPVTSLSQTLAFTRAWSYAGALILGRNTALAIRARDGQQRELGRSAVTDPAMLCAWLREQVGG
jgi:ATP phosphoribosyltransferase regulatory subunit